MPVQNIDSDSSDTDDFVNLPPKLRSGSKRKTPPVKTKKKDPAVSSQNILSSKRATKKAKKLCEPVEVLNPGVFPHGRRARMLRDYILSKNFREKYKE